MTNKPTGIGNKYLSDKTRDFYGTSEILTTVIMKVAVFWNVYC
jgi:hypothetical protein